MSNWPSIAALLASRTFSASASRRAEWARSAEGGVERAGGARRRLRGGMGSEEELDNVDDVGALTVISTLPSGSQFQTGDTIVFFIAEDSSGNDGMVSMNVRVLAPPP